MQLQKLDPRALSDHPSPLRRSKSNPQADALLLATIKAVGIVQPPVVTPMRDGGNGYVIDIGHRRVKQAIAAGLTEIEVLVAEAADDQGAMRSMIENSAREALNPVDQWRAVERLVALGWTEEAIGLALALPVRQIRKLRLLANVLPAMLDHMARGDMPNEKHLRTIASAPLVEQKEVWKKHKPSKGEPEVTWWNVAQGLEKTRMYARDASFGDDLAQAYGIDWSEDLFAPADEDSRYTIDVEAFLGAQQEWMTTSLPKKGIIAEVNSWGEPILPKKATRIYGKPGKSDSIAMYLDRHGKVQCVPFQMPQDKKAKGKAGAAVSGELPDDTDDSVVEMPIQQRPDVTQKGQDMIGDFRTDALHDALARAPIEDDTLMALLVLAFSGLNVRVDSGATDQVYGSKRFQRHAAGLFSDDGRLDFDKDNLRIAARSVLIEVLSCRRNMSNSGVVSRIAGEVIGADRFLPGMGTQEFLLCLSRQALEAACHGTSVLPRQRVRDTRAALVEHFEGKQFVHPSALFAPDPEDVANLIRQGETPSEDDPESAANAVDGGQEALNDATANPDGSDPDGGDDVTADEPVDDLSEDDRSVYPMAAE